MEAENKLYADMHGDGQSQPATGPPQYTPTPQQQGWDTLGYPPSTMVASPYYAPPSGVGYDGGYGAPSSQQQQQQQQVVHVRPNHVPRSNLIPAESFAGAIIYACIVFLCCNWIFGLIGVILAAMASDKAVSDADGARKLGCASYTVSTVGIIITVVFLIVFFTVYYPL